MPSFLRRQPEIALAHNSVGLVAVLGRLGQGRALADFERLIGGDTL
jgi:hypothetical protein